MISIIVPAFNAEKTIERCIMSIVKQTYKEIEIIVVNDGSTDCTENVLKQLCCRYSNIKVFTQINQGLSAARNKGIDESQGDYLAFVDSDDCISSVMIERLYRSMKKENSDIAICGFQKVYEPFSIKEHYEEEMVNSYPIRTVRPCTALHNINGKKSNIGLYGVEAWNKLYKKELFENIRFPVGMLFEDNFIMHRLFHRANKITYIELPMYFYVQTDGSIINSKYSDKKFEGLKGFEERIVFFSKYYPQLEDEGMEFYLRVLISHYSLACKSKDKKNLKRISNKYKTVFRKRIKSKNKISIKYRLFYVMPAIYAFILNNR